MKKTLAIVFIVLYLFGLVSCKPKELDSGYESALSYVGLANDWTIYDDALNNELLQRGRNEHLPIFKLDTLEDLEQFKSKYENTLSMNRDYDEVLSFEGALAKSRWDEADFFNEHSLLVVYVSATSGSYRFFLHEVEVKDSSVCVYVEREDIPEDKCLTMDMAGWCILVAIKDEEIRGQGSFDAILNNFEK